MFAISQSVSLLRRAAGICSAIGLVMHSVLAFAADKPAVSVLYAGSLATVMEKGIGPAFMKATGYIPGAPILFTITIPEAAPHHDAAVAFVHFVLASQDMLRQFGFGNVEHSVGGDGNAIPAELRPLTSGVFKP